MSGADAHDGTARLREARAAAVVIVTGLIAITALLLVGNNVFPRVDSGITGKLTYAGGPPGLNSNHGEPGEVVVYLQDGEELARASFGEGDGFSIPLSPGTYRVLPTSGDADCQELTVNVAPGEFQPLSVVCSVM